MKQILCTWTPFRQIRVGCGTSNIRIDDNAVAVSVFAPRSQSASLSIAHVLRWCWRWGGCRARGAHHREAYCDGGPAGSRPSSGTPRRCTKSVVSQRRWRPREIKRSRRICSYDGTISTEYHASRGRVCLCRYRVGCSLD